MQRIISVKKIEIWMKHGWILEHFGRMIGLNVYIIN
jgi:hypothetical protein